MYAYNVSKAIKPHRKGTEQMTHTETAREIEIAMINKLQGGTYGGFAASLGKAYELADLGNREKLKAAFPKIFDMAQDSALLELLDA
jgi:hypothetical protein